jgi:hypothetical protein
MLTFRVTSSAKPFFNTTTYFHTLVSFAGFNSLADSLALVVIDSLYLFLTHEGLPLVHWIVSLVARYLNTASSATTLDQDWLFTEHARAFMASLGALVPTTW